MINKNYSNKNIFNDYTEQIIKGVFLILLLAYGNLIGNTLGCQIQKYIYDNIYIRHLFLFLTLYFATNFVNQNYNISPHIKLLYSLIIYLIILVTGRMDLKFTLISFTLITILYIIITYIDYYNKQKDDHQILIQNLYDAKNIILTIIILVVIIGFSKYLIEKKKEYKSDWRMSKFIFGLTKCQSMTYN